MVNCYKIFVNKKIVLIKGLLAITMLVLPLILATGVPMGILVGALMVASFSILIELIMDFFTFGGIAAKKEKVMEYCRSSIKGPRVVEKGLTGDVVVKFLKMFLIVIISYVSTTLYLNEKITAISILFMLSLVFAALVLIYGGLMITRRFCKTFSIHVIVIYLVMAIGTGLFVPLFYFYICGALIGMITFTLVSGCLSGLFGYLLVREGVNGFKSGYYDI
ncbi:MAG: hypothetical protein MJ123_01280 [Lachnospiraceae bacterium]|nr:hypothetical protein [Lachnospiraceae bacterium]